MEILYHLVVVLLIVAWLIMDIKERAMQRRWQREVGDCLVTIMRALGKKYVDPDLNGDE